jgi:hypothetical protein
MNILHLTTIFFLSILNKILSNDILLRIAKEYERKYSNDNHYFVLILSRQELIMELLNSNRYSRFYGQSKCS